MQKRYFNYRAPLISFDDNIHHFGKLGNGRYHGFDTVEWLSGVTFQVNHSLSGISYLSPQLVTSLPTGVFVTGQGVVIFDDAKTPPLTLQSNANNGKIRYDILVAEHTYTGTQGGKDATYKVIKGQVNNETIPTYNKSTQTLLGIFTIQPNAIDNSGITYTKARTPDVGDGTTARIDLLNAFKGMQQQNKSARTIVNADLFNFQNLSFLDLPNDANLFEINISVGVAPSITIAGIKIKEGAQDGTEIKLYLKGNFSIQDSITQIQGDAGPIDFTQTEPYLKGYRNIVIPNEVKTSGNNFDLTDTSGPAIAVLTLISGSWVMTSFELKAGKFAGLFKGVKQINQSTVLTPSDANLWLWLNTGLNPEVILPNVEEVQDNAIFGFDGRGIGGNGGACGIKTSDGDGSSIWMQPTWSEVVSNKVYMIKRERLWLMKNGKVWFAINAFGNFLTVGETTWSYDKERDGYLAMEGQLLNRADYPRLWAYIQTLGSALIDDDLWLAAIESTLIYGKFSRGDGEKTFRLPNYGGATIRALYNQPGQDLGRSNEGLGVGTFQTDGIKKRDVQIIVPKQNTSERDEGVGKFVTGNQPDEPQATNPFSISLGDSFDTHGRNIALYFLIKY